MDYVVLILLIAVIIILLIIVLGACPTDEEIEMWKENDNFYKD